MSKKVTYYAVVDDYSTREAPGGVLRRVEDENGEYDEEFGHDQAWTRSWLLNSHERGNMDSQFHEISEEEAGRIVERIKGQAGG